MNNKYVNINLKLKRLIWVCIIIQNLVISTYFHNLRVCDYYSQIIICQTQKLLYVQF